MSVYDQPVVLNGKLYVRGKNRGTVTVLEYTPSQDKWIELPAPSVSSFTIAMLKGQLLVVGGRDQSTDKNVKTVLTFDENSQEWVQFYPTMPTALLVPSVVGYHDYLIIAGGKNSNRDWTTDVNILDTVNNKWTKADPLPCAAVYNEILVEDTMYLVGTEGTKTVLRAHVPTLLSGTRSGVWERPQKTPYYRSSPVTIGNTLLTVGGSDKPRGGNPTTSIQMYNPTTNQWTRVGNLPEPMQSPWCVSMGSEMFISHSQSLHVSTLSVAYS